MIVSCLIGGLKVLVMPCRAFAQTIKIVTFGDSPTIGSGRLHFGTIQPMS